MRLAATNEELFGLHWSLVEDAAVERLCLLANADLDGMKDMTAEELVNAGFTDEVRLFVKNELHSAAKVAEGRMRLIMSISVVDQIVERVLNSAQNQLEISRWEDIPSKPGMGLHDEGLQSLERQILKLSDPDHEVYAASSDISGFDWSVPQWALEFDADVRDVLSGMPGALKMHQKRVVCLGLSRFVFSDGVVWDQVEPGIQKSGSYNTSSTNSRIRAMLADLVAWRNGELWEFNNGHLRGGKSMAMGDDAVESASDLDKLPYQYLRLGFVLKEVSRDIEFCAYAFDQLGGFRPVRWLKMLASCLATSVRDESHETELLVALEYELRHCTRLPWAMEVVRASGWGARK